MTSTDITALSAAERNEMQRALLSRHIRYAATHSPFYRRLFANSGIDPTSIRTTADLALLPLTGKGDLEAAPQDFLAVPEAETVDLCLTSGTTGKAVAMLQTRGDLERLTYNEETSFRRVGITAGDRVLLAAAIDRCFMAGLAYFLGLTRIGATVIRGGSSNTTILMELVKTHRPTAMVGVPSLLLAAGERLRQEGTDPAALGIAKIVCIGEPVRCQDLSLSPLGARLAACWNSTVYGTYASTEMATAFTDCGHGGGGHFRPELMVIEIVDENGLVVAPGVTGEVVATPLGVTGMPLIRFRTGDLARLIPGDCPCSDPFPRLGPVVGRKAQMLKYRGTTVYPPAIFSVLQGLPEVRGFYLEVHSDFDLSDRIRVVVGSSGGTDEAMIADRITAAIRVRPEVRLVSPEEVLKKTMQEDKRKPVLFFDCRQPGTAAPDRT